MCTSLILKGSQIRYCVYLFCHFWWVKISMFLICNALKENTSFKIICSGFCENDSSTFSVSILIKMILKYQRMKWEPEIFNFWRQKGNLEFNSVPLILLHFYMDILASVITHPSCMAECPELNKFQYNYLLYSPKLKQLKC